jgi:hypothetical protein
LAAEALGQWGPWARWPFGCMCLWPLIAARLADGRPEEAVVAARELLKAPQMRLPAELEEMVGGAISAWDGAQRSVASERLGHALRLAEELGLV